MRRVLLVVLAANISVQAQAVLRAVIPGCCTSFASLTVMQPATGRITRSFNAGAVSNSLYRTSGIGFVLTKGGGSAAILSSTYPTSTTNTYVVTVLNLNTGSVSAPLTIPGVAYAIALNPQSGVIYVGYQQHGIHVQMINPANLTVLGDVTVNAVAGPIVFSPDGDTLYLPSSGGIHVLKASTFQSTGTVTLSSPAQTMVVSPDGSTLYAGYEPHDVSFVDTATLQVINTISNSALDHPGMLALSPDASQLYIPAGTSISTLQIATLALSTVSLPISGASVAVAPDGSVYLGETQNGPPQIVVFNPALQSVSAIYTSVSAGVLGWSADGNELYRLNYASAALSVTGAVPSQTVVGSEITGAGPGTGTYDSKDDLFLVPDSAGNVDVLDADTLQIKGLIFVATPISSVLFGNTGYALVGPFSPPSTGVVQFDPLNLSVTATSAIPFPANDNAGYYTQPAASGNFLYVPFNFYHVAGGDLVPKPAPTASGGVNYGIAVVDTRKMSVTIWPFHVTAILGFTIARGTGNAYLSVQTEGSSYELLQLDLGNRQILKAVNLGIAGHLASSPDGSTIYMAGQFVASTGYDAVSAIDAQTLTITRNSPLLYLADLSITPDGQYLYCPTTRTGAAGAVDILSTASLQLSGQIPSAAVPAHVLFVDK